MKLIQILVLVAATATASAAQSTSSTSHTSGSSGQSNSTQKASVKLIVPKAGSHSDANASKVNPGGATAAKPAAAQKPPVVQKPPVLTVKPVQKPVEKAKAKSTTAAVKKPVAKPVTPQKKSQVAVVPQKPSSDKKDATVAEDQSGSGASRRDPFVSIIRATPLATGSNCSVGKRCLFIPELELKGIAKDPDGQMMAVVVSNTHRAYFLRENDQVFNGSVQKITSDSVIFREFAVDHLGRETAHDVVKKLPKS